MKEYRISQQHYSHMTPRYIIEYRKKILFFWTKWRHASENYWRLYIHLEDAERDLDLLRNRVTLILPITDQSTTPMPECKPPKNQDDLPRRYTVAEWAERFRLSPGELVHVDKDGYITISDGVTKEIPAPPDPPPWPKSDSISGDH